MREPSEEAILRKTLFNLIRRFDIVLPITEKVHLINYLQKVGADHMEDRYSLATEWLWQRGYRNERFRQVRKSNFEHSKDFADYYCERGNLKIKK